MRTAAGQQDIQRVAVFNGVIHGEALAPGVASLAAHYRGLQDQDFFLVEDEDTRQIISSLMLIPWTISYAGVMLSVGEMGMVGTSEPYRGRGLVRTQVSAFMQRLRERGCLLSLIQGIPYFYRQFGYEYALPLEGGVRLSGRELPERPQPTFSFRPATLDDIPVLVRCYEEAATDLAIHTVRDEEIWRYLLRHGAGDLAAETWIIETCGREPAGYFRLPVAHFGAELAVNEVSQISFDAALAALHWLKELANQRDKPGIRLNLPADCTLVRTARTLGAFDLGTYAWQVHVPDLAALLRTIGPVLEQRVAASPFAGLSQKIKVCFYRDSVTLDFRDGRLMQVAASGPAQGGINFPPHTFTQVLFGHRSADDLRKIFPDVSVAPHLRLLFDTLFPLMKAFLYPSY